MVDQMAIIERRVIFSVLCVRQAASLSERFTHNHFVIEELILNAGTLKEADGKMVKPSRWYWLATP